MTANYKAELRGFALDRAIRLAEANKGLVGHTSLADVIERADEIVDYLYIPDKDIKGLLDAVLPLIINSGQTELLDTLILELQQIRAEMAANIIPVATPVEPVVAEPTPAESAPVEVVTPANEA